MLYFKRIKEGNETMTHDEKQIEILKELKKEYLIIKNLTEEERIKRFLKAMRGEEDDEY